MESFQEQLNVQDVDQLAEKLRLVYSVACSLAHLDSLALQLCRCYLRFNSSAFINICYSRLCVKIDVWDPTAQVIWQFRGYFRP